jgi:hypothetical protein
MQNEESSDRRPVPLDAGPQHLVDRLSHQSPGKDLDLGIAGNRLISITPSPIMARSLRASLRDIGRSLT